MTIITLDLLRSLARISIQGGHRLALIRATNSRPSPTSVPAPSFIASPFDRERARVCLRPFVIGVASLHLLVRFLYLTVVSNHDGAVKDAGRATHVCRARAECLHGMSASPI